MLRFDLMSLFTDVDSVIFSEHSNKRINYNADRKCEEDFVSTLLNVKIASFEIDDVVISNQKVDLTKQKTLSFVAHKDQITTLTIMISANKRLLTSGLDHFIKVWSLEGELLGALNINHPLPIQWLSKEENTNTHKRKILYSLKVIENVLIRYKNRMLFSEERKISVNKFLKSMAGVSSPEHPSTLDNLDNHQGSTFLIT